MTQNQIAFQNVRELERHNRAQEIEGKRHNIVSEAYQEWQNKLTALGQQEVMRSNLANEEIRRQQNAINAAVIQENVRHNLTSEQLQGMINAANAANAYASASLSREKANTEIAQQGYIGAQTETEKRRPGNVESSTGLNVAQTNQATANVGLTEAKTTREQFGLVTDAVNAIWGIVSDIFSGGVNVMRVTNEETKIKNMTKVKSK